MKLKSMQSMLSPGKKPMVKKAIKAVAKPKVKVVIKPVKKFSRMK